MTQSLDVKYSLTKLGLLCIYRTGLRVQTGSIDEHGQN